MRFDFSPGSVGPLSDGMVRDVVRTTLGGKYSVFRKSEFATNSTDKFSGLGVFVYYSPDDVIKGAELFPPTASLMYRGKNLLASNYSDVCSFLRSHGVAYSEDESQVEISTDKIRLYIPDKLEDPNAKVDSAYVVLGVRRT